ncbi:MAG: M48 family metalloprotease [Alphaproteobacteria bacterium]
MFRTITIVFGALLLLSPHMGSAAAQGRDISFIRDAEIENTIRAYATPIFTAANLDANAVRIHLVADGAINAFVAGGQQLFIHTGLLTRAERPGQVIGVIAHEAGHITGGHLARLQDELRNATAKSIAAFVLAAAAGIATGSSEAATAVIVGGQQVAVQGFLRYSRGQESAADAAALTLLDRTGQSANGLLQFFDILEREQATSLGRGTAYSGTHPLTASRRSTVANHLALSRYANVPESPDLVRQHERMVAKLVGFLWPHDKVLETYPESDLSVAGRYARSISLFRRGDLEPALALINSLIDEQPADPYFLELKGQMLFENGHIEEALGPYQASVELAPNEPLLLADLARIQLEMNDPTLLDAAKGNLEQALRIEPQLGGAWRQLAIANGRLGEIGQMALAQAELSALIGDRSAAKAHAERAERELPLGSPGWLRAQDLQQQLDRKR